MTIGMAEFTSKDLFFRHLIIITVSKYDRFHDKNLIGNHKWRLAIIWYFVPQQPEKLRTIPHFQTDVWFEFW